VTTEQKSLQNIERQLKELSRGIRALNNTLVEVGRFLKETLPEFRDLTEELKLSDGREIHTPATCDELCARYRFGRGHDIDCPTLKEKHWAGDACVDGHVDLRAFPSPSSTTPKNPEEEEVLPKPITVPDDESKTTRHRVVIIDKLGKRHEIAFAEVRGTEMQIYMTEHIGNEIHDVMVREDIDHYVIELPEGDREIHFPGNPWVRNWPPHANGFFLKPLLSSNNDEG